MCPLKTSIINAIMEVFLFLAFLTHPAGVKTAYPPFLCKRAALCAALS